MAKNTEIQYQSYQVKNTKIVFWRKQFKTFGIQRGLTWISHDVQYDITALSLPVKCSHGIWDFYFFTLILK